MEHQHFLLLGATGISGVTFIKQVLELPQKPYVTLVVRSGSIPKLPAAALTHGAFRIIQGELTDADALKAALAADVSFPAVNIVVSFLGAYVALKPILTRDKSHPIADAFVSTILPAMEAAKVKRILALSTPAGWHSAQEAKTVPWKWWFYMKMPLLLAPQGNAEMAAIASAIVSAGDRDKDLEWTVFRVPHLTEGHPDADVVAGYLDQSFSATLDLSRGSLVKWVLDEVENRAWVRGTPMLANSW